MRAGAELVWSVC